MQKRSSLGVNYFIQSSYSLFYSDADQNNSLLLLHHWLQVCCVNLGTSSSQFVLSMLQSQPINLFICPDLPSWFCCQLPTDVSGILSASWAMSEELGRFCSFNFSCDQGLLSSAAEGVHFTDRNVFIFKQLTKPLISKCRKLVLHINISMTGTADHKLFTPWDVWFVWLTFLWHSLYWH